MNMLHWIVLECVCYRLVVSARARVGLLQASS